MSLFGGGQSAFGHTATQPAASTAQPTAGGLFGASTASKPSMFGASTATTAQPSTTPFGGLGQSTQSSAFGATNTTAKPSLFGGALGSTTTAQNQGQAQIPSLGTAPSSLGLSTLGASTQQQGQQQQQGGQQPAGAYFDTLFAMTKKRTDGTTEDMPHLQLGLGDLRQRLKKIGGKTPEKAVDGRAHYVLAASGIDLGAAAKDLGSLAVNPSKVDRHASDMGGPSEVDVETYLENLQKKTTLGMIQDGLERSARDFDNFLEDNMATEWEAQRKRIYQHFGIMQRDTGADSATPGREAQAGFGRSRRKSQHAGAGAGTGAASRAGRSTILGNSNLQRSVIGTPRALPEFSDVERPSEPSRQLGGVQSSDDRAMREKQSKLADKITTLNKMRTLQRPFPILSELAEIEQKSPEPHASYVTQAYRAVMEIVGENPEAETSLNNATAKERQYVSQYLDDNKNSSEALNMRKRILVGGNRFLEHLFVAEMESLIAKHPHEANLGGRPDIVSKVKAYIRLRSARKDLVPDNSELQQVQGEYVWAIVFYLLRSGHVMDAARYVNDNLNNFRGIDRTFSTYLNAYASSEERRLKRLLQERCARVHAKISQRTRELD
ncbi:unnamed protein product [Parascedosporium putredinis]|uniref:Nuclear pore protein n=1 Tax=Parascedosporium putredinis TaxID=1442378 RepID=A0A9P1MDZ4_9PEZI|nr:unnamed protein product [Parascedosporium putredinis]CAI8001559.1 unnamed protein product [Parascedosporium putredinis]